MGKHSKKNKVNFNFIIILILVIIIIIGILALIYKIQKDKTNDFSSQNLDDTIMITYINKDNSKTIIKDNQAINEHITIISNKGTIYIKKENDKNYEKYNGEALEDGDYVVIAKTENGISSEKVINIDTKSPSVSNIANKRTYNIGQEMTITDNNQIVEVDLKLEDGTKIPVLKDGEETKSIKYTFEQKGNYTLEVKDKAGNKTRQIAFTIE